MKHRLRIERRGRKRKFRATWPLMIIITFMAIVSFCGYKSRVADVFAQEAVASEKISNYANYHASNLAEENQLLREKLERSAKTAAPETTKALVRFYIHKYFPQSEWANAEKVTTCESGMNPMSLNDKNRNGSVDRGLFQINSVHAQRFQQMYGVDWNIGAHDLDLSTKYAKFLYDHSGWGPWVCAKIVHV